MMKTQSMKPNKTSTDQALAQGAQELGLKKPLQIMYGLLLVVLVLAPVVVFYALKSHIDTENYEQRTLSPFPFSQEARDAGQETTIETFPSQFESWLNDHLPFRNQLLTLYGALEYHVLHTTSSQSVIVGKDGWLFYKGAQVADEDPIGDYMGTNLFTQEELEKIAANFTAARDELAGRGCSFTIYIAPNKERVYSEYMPDMYGEPATDNRAVQLVNYLTENTDLTVIWGYDEIMTYRAQNPDTDLYFKYDTHWNNLGAYIGCEKLVNTLGFDFTPLEYVTVEDRHTGSYDLARLIHLEKQLTDCPYYLLSGYTPHPLQTEQEDGGKVLRFTTTDGAAPGGKLFVIGDSFSTMMSPYLACHYQSGYTTFYYNYSHGQLLREEPTAVVYETVERYVGNMLDFTLVDGYQGNLTE